MDKHTERVRRRAYQIWLEEGRPEGREAIHWDMASELVAIEDRQNKTTKPVRRQSGDKERAATRPEPAAPAAAMGELPTMTDAGEQAYPPSREARRETARPAPVSRAANAKARAEQGATSAAAVAAAKGDDIKSSPGKSAPSKTKPTKRGKT